MVFILYQQVMRARQRHFNPWKSKYVLAKLSSWIALQPSEMKREGMQQLRMDFLSLTKNLKSCKVTFMVNLSCYLCKQFIYFITTSLLHNESCFLHFISHISPNSVEGAKNADSGAPKVLGYSAARKVSRFSGSGVSWHPYGWKVTP